MSAVCLRVLLCPTTLLLFTVLSGTVIPAAEPDRVITIWSGLAPGETSNSKGSPLPRRANESPPATRVGGITQPTLDLFDADPTKKTGTAVLIFPGGAYNYVVVDKEGSEAAEWLNELGITAFVVRYRTKHKGNDAPDWIRPLQDGQRAVSLVRHHAKELGIDPNRIGVLGFSAGGQTAAMVSTRFPQRSYESVDAADGTSCRPDFAMLVYPWRLVDETGELSELLPVSSEVPPTFLVHAHDDHATSLSSVRFYVALKNSDVAAELHIYQSGGHGYGMRPVENSDVDTWPARAADWLRRRHLATMAAVTE